MKILITGGAGFIGSNLAKDYIDSGCEVVIFDNLSRPGTEINLEWLKSQKKNLAFCHGDIRSDIDIKHCFTKYGKFDVVFHLAAQVAVTASVTDPQKDFEINAIGTFNLLEAIRHYSPHASVLYASTNKVYGNMEHLVIEETADRYEYRDLKKGVSEAENLDFHSPYGCSKGVSDQYFIDYARIYDLNTVVMRQSCIYGYRQFGIEDQGWVAWFTIAANFNKKISIYGDGKQVRDVLFIDDLIDSYKCAIENIDITRGQAYNMGGGQFNLSLLELIKYLEDCYNKKIDFDFSEWRPGDQKVFIADTTKAKRDFNWEPKTPSSEGIKKLVEWVSENTNIFENVGII